MKRKKCSQARKFVFPAAEKKEIIIVVSRILVLFERPSHVTKRRSTEAREKSSAAWCRVTHGCGRKAWMFIYRMLANNHVNSARSSERSRAAVMM